MTDPALVSVTIAAHNALPYLTEALASAVAQTYRPLEVVVVDDASTDGTAEAARSFGPPVSVVRQSERRGIGASRNLAIERSSGACLAFLDADDRFRPEAIHRLHDVLDADPELDMVFAHVREFVSDDLSIAERQRLRAPVEQAPGRLPTQMLIRRASFLRVGPFATELRRGVTLDWSARAFEAGLRYVVLDDVLFERRLHLENNGLREKEHTGDYVRVLKAAIDRRRGAAAAADSPPAAGGEAR